MEYDNKDEEDCESLSYQKSPKNIKTRQEQENINIFLVYMPGQQLAEGNKRWGIILKKYGIHVCIQVVCKTNTKLQTHDICQ